MVYCLPRGWENLAWAVSGATATAGWLYELPREDKRAPDIEPWVEGLVADIGGSEPAATCSDVART